MRKYTRIQQSVTIALCVLILGCLFSAYAVNPDDPAVNIQNEDSLVSSKTYYYGATVYYNGGGSFTYSIPYNDYFAHTGWYVEFAGTLIPDEPITSMSGNLYAPNAINIYFYYLA